MRTSSVPVAARSMLAVTLAFMLAVMLAVMLAFALACAAPARVPEASEPGGLANRVVRTGQDSNARSLLAHVDAQAMYVFASLRPMSPDNLAQGLRVLEVVSEPFLEPLPLGWFIETPGERVRRAISEDFHRRVDASAFRSIGIDLGQPFLLWSVGVLPAARLPLASRDAFMQYLESVSERAHAPIEKASLEGQEYLTLPLDRSFSLAVVVRSRMVLVAVIPRLDPHPTMARVLGIDRPTTSLAKAGTWDELRQRYDLNVEAFGYFDTARAIRYLDEDLDAFNTAQSEAIWAGYKKKITATCVDEIRRFFGHVPRVLMGFDDQDDGHSRVRGVFELSDETSEILTRSVIPFPWLERPPRASGSGPLLTFSLGLDLDEMRYELSRIRDTYFQCQITGALADMSYVLVHYLDQLDPAVNGFEGLHVAVEESSADGNGETSLVGYAIVVHVRPEAILEALEPLLGTLKVVDGGPPLTLPLFFLPGRPTLRIGRRDTAIVVALGESMYERALAVLAEKAPERTGTNRSAAPIALRIGYHGARLYQLAERHPWLYPILDQAEGREADTPEELARLRSQDALDARGFSHNSVSLVGNALVIDNVMPASARPE